jgi:hypothetical protein
MGAGAIQFACMMIAVCAVMNSRVYTKAELAKTEKIQSDAFSDIRFPTYGTIQQAVLFQSYSGTLVETNLHSLLIASTTPAPRGETLAHRNEQMIDDIIGGGRRK